MLHRAADRPARPEVPRRATGLARRRRLVGLLLSGWDCDRSRLRVAGPPCLSGWCGWRLRPGFTLRLPRRSAQASPLQSAANRLRRRRLSGLASGRRLRGCGPSDASCGDGDRRLDPSVVSVRGLRTDRSPTRHCRRGGLASRRKTRRRPRLGARHVIRWIDRPSGLLSPPGNRKRDLRQSSEPERADSQPGEPKTGESADRDRGLAEAARPIVVLRHEDGSLGLRARRRNPCRCLSLDRRGRHSDVLLSLYTEKMPDRRGRQAQNLPDLQNFYTRFAWFWGRSLGSRRPTWP
jgi:hypothetical protein